VGAGRVRYWHNGAESSRDSMELALKLVEKNGYLLPAYLQVSFTYALIKGMGHQLWLSVKFFLLQKNWIPLWPSSNTTKFY